MGMADISNKDISVREAVAECKVLLCPHIIGLIKNKKIPKGDVLETARAAALLAAKKTPSLIPLCHPIPIEYMDIGFSPGKNCITIKATVKTEAKTGVEMEALTAVSVAALTVYDMCKPVDKDIVISGIRLLSKKGGRSGDYAIEQPRPKKAQGKKYGKGQDSRNIHI